MKTRLVLLLLVVFGAAAVLFVQAKGASGDIVIDNADFRNDLTIAASGDLNTLIGSVAPRFVVQYANNLVNFNLNSPSPDLQALIQQVENRPVIQYANEVNQLPLGPLSADLHALLLAVADRPVIQYANANRNVPLAYPSNLVNDTVSPRLVTLTVVLQGRSTVWFYTTTSEFCQMILQYGSAPGSYTDEISDPLFSKQQALKIDNLIPKKTYYYRTKLIDRAGNVTYTDEKQFAISLLYIPYTKR